MTTFRSPPRDMPTITNEQAQRAIRSGADFAVTTPTGGVSKQTYWTPDGRMLKAVPNIRDFVKKDKDGNTIGSGRRDANLDKGWLLQPPVDAERKLFCRWCDGWHDTEVELIKCKEAYDSQHRKRESMAKTEMSNEIMVKDKQIDELTRKLEALEKLVREKLG